jgi:hypothetical protein
MDCASRASTVLRLFVVATDLQCDDGPGQLADVPFSFSVAAADRAGGVSSDAA